MLPEETTIKQVCVGRVGLIGGAFCVARGAGGPGGVVQAVEQFERVAEFEHGRLIDEGLHGGGTRKDESGGTCDWSSGWESPL